MVATNPAPPVDPLDHHGLVGWAVARVVARRGGRVQPADKADLEQAAWLLVVRHAARHDPALGFRFSTGLKALHHPDVVWQYAGLDFFKRGRAGRRPRPVGLDAAFAGPDGDRYEPAELGVPGGQAAADARLDGDRWKERYLAALDPKARAVVAAVVDFDTGERRQTVERAAAALGMSYRTARQAFARATGDAPGWGGEDRRPAAEAVLTAEQAADLYRRYQAGEALSALAAEHGVHPMTVARAARRHARANGLQVRTGSPARGPKITGDRLARAFARYAAGGERAAALAAEHGVDRKTFYDALRRHAAATGQAVPRQFVRKFGRADVPAVLARVRAGEAVPAIAAERGASADAVYRLLRRYAPEADVRPAKTGPPPELVARVRALRAEGRSYREVAAACGLSHTMARTIDLGAAGAE